MWCAFLQPVCSAALVADSSSPWSFSAACEGRKGTILERSETSSERRRVCDRHTGTRTEEWPLNSDSLSHPLALPLSLLSHSARSPHRRSLSSRRPSAMTEPQMKADSNTAGDNNTAGEATNTKQQQKETQAQPQPTQPQQQQPQPQQPQHLHYPQPHPHPHGVFQPHPHHPPPYGAMLMHGGMPPPHVYSPEHMLAGPGAIPPQSWSPEHHMAAAAAMHHQHQQQFGPPPPHFYAQGPPAGPGQPPQVGGPRMAYPMGGPGGPRGYPMHPGMHPHHAYGVVPPFGAPPMMPGHPPPQFQPPQFLPHAQAGPHARVGPPHMHAGYYAHHPPHLMQMLPGMHHSPPPLPPHQQQQPPQSNQPHPTHAPNGQQQQQPVGDSSPTEEGQPPRGGGGKAANHASQHPAGSPPHHSPQPLSSLQLQQQAHVAQSALAMHPQPQLHPSDTPYGEALFKTELCKSFAESRYCRYGLKCRFAHGLADLRAVTRHKKFKTEQCKNFSTTGSCPYGPRCRFIHNPETRDQDELPGLGAVSDPALVAGLGSPVTGPMQERAEYQQQQQQAGAGAAAAQGSSQQPAVSRSPQRSPQAHTSPYLSPSPDSTAAASAAAANQSDEGQYKPRPNSAAANQQQQHRQGNQPSNAAAPHYSSHAPQPLSQAQSRSLMHNRSPPQGVHSALPPHGLQQQQFLAPPAGAAGFIRSRTTGDEYSQQAPQPQQPHSGQHPHFHNPAPHSYADRVSLHSAPPMHSPISSPSPDSALYQLGADAPQQQAASAEQQRLNHNDPVASLFAPTSVSRSPVIGPSSAPSASAVPSAAGGAAGKASNSPYFSGGGGGAGGVGVLPGLSLGPHHSPPASAVAESGDHRPRSQSSATLLRSESDPEVAVGGKQGRATHSPPIGSSRPNAASSNAMHALQLPSAVLGGQRDSVSPAGSAAGRSPVLTAASLLGVASSGSRKSPLLASNASPSLSAAVAAASASAAAAASSASPDSEEPGAVSAGGDADDEGHTSLFSSPIIVSGSPGHKAAVAAAAASLELLELGPNAFEART